MLSDAIVSVRCPQCGERLGPLCLRSAFEYATSACETYLCPCGFRFVVEVSPAERCHTEFTR